MRFNTDVPPANDNNGAPRARRTEPPGPAERPSELGEQPKVRTPRGRPHATYACAHGVILPLRFARRMSGWDGEGRARPSVRGPGPRRASPR
jgi:hypothetical protein